MTQFIPCFDEQKTSLCVQRGRMAVRWAVICFVFAAAVFTSDTQTRCCFQEGDTFIYNPARQEIASFRNVCRQRIKKAEIVASFPMGVKFTQKKILIPVYKPVIAHKSLANKKKKKKTQKIYNWRNKRETISLASCRKKKCQRLFLTSST